MHEVRSPSRRAQMMLRQIIVLARGVKAAFLVLLDGVTTRMAVFAGKDASLMMVFNGSRLLRERGAASADPRP